MKRTSVARNVVMVVVFAIIAASPGVARSAQEAATPAAGAAPEVPTFVLQPLDHAENGYFRLELEAGSSATLKVLIGNGGNSPFDARIYVADAYTIQNGGFGLRKSTDEKTDVSTWIDFPTQELTYGPGEGMEQTFSVTVPKGTAPGQYIAGVAIETAEPMSAGQSDSMLQFNQVLRSAVAVFITVPGPRQPAFDIGDASYELVGALNTIFVDIHNTGNVLVTPKGQLTVFDAQNAMLFSTPITMGVVYAGDDTQIAIGLAQPLPPGDYHLSLNLSDEASGVSASRDDLSITSAAPATPTANEPLRITSATAEAKPSADAIQFLSVSATIQNDGEPIESVSVILHAYKDGQLVEDFPIASSVTLQTGETVIENRYLPLDGWSSGTWTFSLTVEVVTPGTGSSLVLLTSDVGEPVVVK